MTYSKITVVIPTLWKFNAFIPFLLDLKEYQGIDIVLVDNAPKNGGTFETEGNLWVKSFGRNIGVNPAWNYGAEVAAIKGSQLICFLNDDVIFDFKLFQTIRNLYNGTKNVGMAGLNPGRPEFNQPPFKSGVIRFDVCPPGAHTFGMGCLFFVPTHLWIDIPDGLNVYYGDNWVFDTLRIRGFDNYYISDMLHYTPFAQTTKDLVNKDEILAKETEIYNKELAKFRK